MTVKKTIRETGKIAKKYNFSLYCQKNHLKWKHDYLNIKLVITSKTPSCSRYLKNAERDFKNTLKMAAQFIFFSFFPVVL